MGKIMPRAPRTLQACQECRKSKTKCDGRKPQCAGCSRKRRPCCWPQALVPGGYRTILFTDPESPREESTAQFSTSCKIQSIVQCVVDDSLLTLKQRLVGVFSRTHQAVELCGCIQLDMLKDQPTCGEDAFLQESILALSALYVTDAEVKLGSSLDGAKALMRHYLSKAQESSRNFSDHPTITTIQANLVLGLCELLTMESSKAWIHVGLAMRLAQTLRMRNENNRRHAPRQREIRRRTFWACIILDRLVAYCTFRTQTIDLALVGIHLPCSDTAFAFGHESPGPRTNDLGREANASSESFTLAYFVNTLTLWSPLAQIYVDGGRWRLSQNLPTDLCERYHQNEEAMKAFVATLPNHMVWSESNLQAHQCLGQIWQYVNMHLLIQHARFLLHQEYLPQREDAVLLATVPLSPVSETASGLAHGPNMASIEVCLDGARQIISMLRTVDQVANNQQSFQPSIFAGIAIVTSASVLLWTSYCSDHIVLPRSLKIGDPHQAKLDVDYLLAILDSWAGTWTLARVWANSIRLLEEFYKSAYDRTLQHSHIVQSSAARETATLPLRIEMEAGTASPTRLRDGDGFPDLGMIPPETYYKIRMITGLVLEQPELCKIFFYTRDELSTEGLEQQIEPLDGDLDLWWMNDPDFLITPSTWVTSTFYMDD